MSGSKDTKEEHGSQESQQAAGQDAAPDRGHSGHGSASALEWLHSQRKEWQQGGNPDDAAGAHGQ